MNICIAGPPECRLTVDATAKSDTSITVELMWTNCEGAEPSSVTLRLSPSTAQDPIVINGVAKDINNLMANTRYRIMASFNDACGNISAMAEAITLGTTGTCRPLFMILVISPVYHVDPCCIHE